MATACWAKRSAVSTATFCARWPARPRQARWCWAKLRGDQPIRPSPGQRIAVRQQQNIRPLNVHTDSDDIVRRLPLTFTIDGAKVPAMAVELAARALGDRA